MLTRGMKKIVVTIITSNLWSTMDLTSISKRQTVVNPNPSAIKKPTPQRKDEKVIKQDYHPFKVQKYETKEVAMQFSPHISATVMVTLTKTI